MSLSKRFLSGVLTGMWSVVLKTALNLLLIPVLLHAVGAELYGLYILLVGILELSILMDLGLSVALAQCLGIYQADQRDPRPLLHVGHGVYIALALGVLAIGFFLLPFFPALFHIAPIWRETVDLCLVILLLQATLELYTLYYRAILLSHNLNPWTNVGDMLQSVLSSGAGLLLLLNGYGLPALFLASLAASCVRAGLMIGQTLRVEKVPFFSLLASKGSIPWKKTTQELFKFSAHAMLVNLSVQVSHKTDAFVIALFLPLRAIGVYEIVFRFLGITQQIGIKVCEGLFPMFVRLTQQAKHQEARQVFLRMSHFLCFLTGLVLLLIVMLYPELFALFSAGEIPMAETLPILAMVVPLFISGALQMPASMYLFTSGRQRFLTVSSLVAALVNLILSLLLVKPFGIIGVGLGTLIPQLIQHQASLIRAVRKELQISLSEYLREVYGKNSLFLVGVGLWVAVWHPFIPQTGALQFFFLGMLCLSSFVLGAAFWIAWGTSSPEKELLRQLLGSRLHRLSPAMKEGLHG